MIADIEELGEMDASEIHARRLNAKEVLKPIKGSFFLFSQSKMEQSKFLEEIDVSDHPPSSGMVLNEEMKFFQGESDGLFLTSYTAITFNPELTCTCRKKNHFPLR